MYLTINMYVVSKNSFLSQIKQPHGRYASLFMVVVNCLHSIALSSSADICLGIPSSIFFQCPRRSGEVCSIWHYIMNMFKPCLRQKKNPTLITRLISYVLYVATYQYCGFILNSLFIVCLCFVVVVFTNKVLNLLDLNFCANKLTSSPFQEYTI